MKESAMLAMGYIHSIEEWASTPKYSSIGTRTSTSPGAIPKGWTVGRDHHDHLLASIYTQRKVRPNLAMTGEITLRGRFYLWWHT